MDEDKSTPTTHVTPDEAPLVYRLVPMWDRMTVGVSFTLKKLEEIETQSQSFLADVVIQLRVRDDRENREVAFVHPDQLRLFSIIEIENALEVHSKELWTSRLQYNGNIFLYNIRVRARFSSPFDLRAFPRDVQQLRISLKSRVPADQMRLVPADDPDVDLGCPRAARVTLDEMGFKLQDEWSLGKAEGGEVERVGSRGFGGSLDGAVSIRRFLTGPEESLSGTQYTRVHLITTVLRRPEVVDGLAMLSLLFSVVAAVAAALLSGDEDKHSDLLATAATLLVTSQAFRDAISEMLPAVAYETQFSRLISRVTVLLVVLTLTSIVSRAFPTSQTHPVCFVDETYAWERSFVGYEVGSILGKARAFTCSFSPALPFLFLLGTFLDYRIGPPPSSSRRASIFFSFFPGLATLYHLYHNSPLSSSSQTLHPSPSSVGTILSPSGSEQQDPWHVLHAPAHLSRSESYLPIAQRTSITHPALANCYLRFRVNSAGNTVAEVFRDDSTDSDPTPHSSERSATSEIAFAGATQQGNASVSRRAPTPDARAASPAPRRRSSRRRASSRKE